MLGEKRIREALTFPDDDKGYRQDAIYFIDDVQNSPERYTIVKTTDNGKYLIGKMLHYTFRGVEIITDSDNAIFVDEINNTVFVREYSRALREINPEDPEQRQYVMLLIDPYSDDGGVTRWESVIGRTTAYEWIKSNVESFDPKKSLIITENVALKDAFTISQFCKHLKNADIVEDPYFNIEDYEFEDYDD